MNGETFLCCRDEAKPSRIGFTECRRETAQWVTNHTLQQALKASNPLSQSQCYIMTDGQSAILPRCHVPIWDPWPIFLLLPLIIFRQLRVCWCEASSLTRSLVCSLQLLQGIAGAAFLRSQSHGTHEHILMPPQERGSPVIPPSIEFKYWIPYKYYRGVKFVPHREHTTSPLQTSTG
jgi:hypothetical protein